MRKKEFYDALVELAPEDGKLIVFVDELDRCKPTYAIKVLERIKHYFSVPNIIIYILSFMLSLIGGSNSGVFASVAPFGYAITAASFGAGVPAVIVCVVTLIGTGIKFGGSGLLFL